MGASDTGSGSRRVVSAEPGGRPVRSPGPLLIIISGPSGSGKTTVCRRLVERNGFVRSVSATTRVPRPGEKPDVNYYYMTREEFQAELKAGGFLEHSEHFDNLYGTPRHPVEKALGEGRVVVLEIDVNGARQVKENLAARTPTLLLFVNAPSREELVRRLSHRPGTTDDAVVKARLARADMEMRAGREFFDHEVINDDVGRAVAEIESLVNSRSGGAPLAGMA
jgi:guanylate kinase